MSLEVVKYVPKPLVKAAFRSAIVLRKQSPNILFGAGVAGAIASTVMACKATLRLSDELPKMKQELENARNDSKELSESEQKKAIAVVYGTNAGKVARYYGPSVLLGAVSIGALTGSHVVLSKRNASLTAAYAAVSKAYEDYRNRVRDEHGEEKEIHTYHGAENKGTKKEPDIHVDPTRMSPYAKFFDQSSSSFSKNADMNRMFIMSQQEYANMRLQSRGFVFLNEVYEALGLPLTGAGGVVGWVISKDGGDNYIDFGIFETRNAAAVNGEEPVFLLDFNVDGVIYDKI